MPARKSTPKKAKSGNQNKTRKLKAKKLEERIAPGMLGGGIVDPGMAEPTDSEDQSQQQSADQVDQTQTEAAPAGEGTVEPQESGQYVEDGSQSGPILDAEGNYAGTGEYADHTEADGDQINNEQAAESLNAEADAAGTDTQTDGTESQGWTESDWVTENADGGVQIDPPEGVSVDDGVATFPVDVANESLATTEGVEFQADGSVSYALPEGAEFHEDAGVVSFPPDSPALQTIPESLDSYSTPDGNINVALPSDGYEYDADTNSLSFDNSTANEIAPNNFEIQDDGSVEIALPEGVEPNDDGSIDLSSDQLEDISEPPPEYVSDLDWAEYNEDGSVTCETPEGCHVEDGIATFSCDSLDENLNIPEEFTINPDGSMDVQVPEGTLYDAELNALTFPEGEVHSDELPQEMVPHENPDGSLTATLPDGMEYNEDTGAVHMDNYWANEVCPDSCMVEENGDFSVALPEDTQIASDGSEFTIPAEQINFVDTPTPDYVHDADFSSANGDGSYTLEPPSDFTLTEGTLEVPFEAIGEHIPMPDEVTLNADGTMDYALPEGSQFDSDTGTLTFPEGTVHLSEVPEGLEASYNEDGTVSVVLPDGIEFNADANSCHCDNYWTNEVTPDAIEFSESGTLSIDLPSTAEYQDDGSIQIPAESADFLENPEPTILADGPDWAQGNPDGSVSFDVPESYTVDVDAGTVTAPIETFNSDYADAYPEDFTINPDGSSTHQLSDGTQWDAEAGSLTFPAGEMHMDEIPEGIEASLAEDGSISVILPDGMEYDAEANAVNMDNYWTNEVTPECVEYGTDGSVICDLPHDTQYHEGGDFTVPVDSVDFVENPDPGYVADPPEYMDVHSDGSYTIEPPEGMTLDAEQGTVTMTADSFQEQMPEDEGTTFNADGSSDHLLPEGTTFSAEAGTISFPPGEMHMNEIPEGISAELGDDGGIIVTLPDGMEYNAETNSVHMDNHWTNEVIPDAMEFTADGNMQFDLPEDTQYHDGGEFTVSAESADFLNYEPEGQAAAGDEQAA